MVKFGFKIRTRGGMVVDNLQIGATDRAEAERKVGQIYQRCEILECVEMHAGAGRSAQPGESQSLDLESAIDLIDEEADSPPRRKS